MYSMRPRPANEHWPHSFSAYTQQEHELPLSYTPALSGTEHSVVNPSTALLNFIQPLKSSD